MLDVFISGLINGNSYVLIAIGISLIFGVANLVKFAHGSIFALGAMVGWWFVAVLQWPLWATLLGTVVITAILGMAVEFFCVRPLVNAPPIATLLATLAASFQAVRAVDGVSFTIQSGQVVSLIGPNGSGKTSLLNLISGVLRPTSGGILFNGQRISGRGTERIAERGIARTFQNGRVFGNMSVRDNVLVMDSGKLIAQGTPEVVQNDERVIKAYIGRRRSLATS